MQLQRIVGLVLLILGIVLLVMGLRAIDSFGSQFSRFFTGSPTDRAVWLTIGGAVGVAVGAGIAALPIRGARL
jgi:hypothetical protein